ncbi:MAG: glycosyltransferase family 2 protein [Acidobacteriota bacterium]
MAEPASRPLLSVCIPAYDEEGSIGSTIDTLAAELDRAGVPFELVIANDNSSDGTEAVIRSKMAEGHPIRLVNRRPPGGFGRAIRSCLDHFQGEVVAVVMADMSDDPKDLVRCYETICEGYDAVFGSRFMRGGKVESYPFIKRVANRLGNRLIQLLFWTRHDDLTNAFKVYRADAIRSLLPLRASHFNLTVEISVGLLIRRFKIARLPIRWYGRKHGLAKFKIKELGRRYLATLMKLYADRIFIHDDLMAEHNKTLSTLGAGAEGSRDEVIVAPSLQTLAAKGPAEGPAE